ncbi:MAG TPA: S8 family serine peptidase, partial [Myxococcales bacterium]|nr:S8 family serine peptidase [Myxococcales bacterium]
PGTAKNIITAGAANNVHPFGGADACGVSDTDADSANDIVGFSSRGPCDDARIKPDLVAAGTHVSGGVSQAAGQHANPPAAANGQALSCFDASGVCEGPGGASGPWWPLTSQWTTASSGTSHSTPLIAGAAALTRQYFLNSGTTPSATLIKATLINTTRYMNGTGANDNLYSNNQGMGHLDVGRAFDGVGRFIRDEVAADMFTATGQTRSFQAAVGDNTKPFRVTLAWTDAPGSTTGNSFNNNLDLTVTLNGQTYLGNNFNKGDSITGGTADVRNNVESVFLPAGVTGTATITVTATNINSDGVPNVGGALDQDFALVVYNACTTAPGAPTGLAATVPGLNQIQLNWTAPSGTAPSEYHVLRGTTAGGPYTQVAVVAGGTTTYTDSTVSGGSTYFYVVRGAICAESPNSNESSATATGACRLPPTYAGLASASSAQVASCGITLGWVAATPNCSGSISYNVYRSRTSGFTPGIGNRVATGVTGTSFTDTANLTSGTQYFYVVRAAETVGGVPTEETNTVERSTRPTGPITTAFNYFDNLDGTRPPTNPDSYWVATGTSSSQVTKEACHFQSTTTAWRFGQALPATCPGAYGNSADARLVLGGNGGGGINGFVFPAGSSSSMTFRHAWDFNDVVGSTFFDGATLEFSTTGSAGPFTVITSTPSTTAPYITSGGYNGTTSALGACWTGTQALTNGSFLTTTVNADGLAGRTAWFAWHFRTDSSVVREGYYLDDVSLLSQNIASCSTTT